MFNGISNSCHLVRNNLVGATVMTHGLYLGRDRLLDRVFYFLFMEAGPLGLAQETNIGKAAAQCSMLNAQ